MDKGERGVPRPHTGDACCRNECNDTVAMYRCVSCHKLRSARPRPIRISRPNWTTVSSDYKVIGLKQFADFILRWGTSFYTCSYVANVRSDSQCEQNPTSEAGDVFGRGRTLPSCKGFGYHNLPGFFLHETHTKVEKLMLR